MGWLRHHWSTEVFFKRRDWINATKSLVDTVLSFGVLLVPTAVLKYNLVLRQALSPTVLGILTVFFLISVTLSHYRLRRVFKELQHG